MDLNMPGLDGYAAALLIRKSERPGQRIPIVALTANDARVYRDACLQAGMDDILSKPYTLADCDELLRRWVKGKLEPTAKRMPANLRGLSPRQVRK
jgi:two-component system sensor histidine kinase/response regulator